MAKGARKAAKGAKSPKAGKAERKAPVKPKPGEAGAGAAGKEAPPFISKERMTPGSFLKSLLSECRGFKKNVDSIVGSMRERIAYGKEKKNLNTGVFGWLRKIDGMEAEKAAEWHHTYLHYLESSGILAKIESVQRLPMGDQPKVDGENDEVSDDEIEKHAGDLEPGENPGDADGIKPAANGESANVTRPRFGQKPPAGVSGTDLAKATFKH